MRGAPFESQHNANPAERTMPQCRRILWTLLTAAIAVLAASLPESHANDLAERIDRAIERGVEAVLNKTRKEDVVHYHERNLNGPVVTISGNVIRSSHGTITVEKPDKKRVTISKRLIVNRQRAGYVEPEMSELAHGGPSALAALALLCAGVDANEPRMKKLIDALADDDASGSGTYVHSLRAAVWSQLLDRKLGAESQRRFYRLLNADALWLMRSMGESGVFDYGQNVGTGDNSNTQFGHLGLWSASLGGVEINDRYWRAIADYWLDSQNPGGGWCYRGRNAPTPSMTVAGCNSLYIALDRYYSRADKPYAYFRGAPPNAPARRKMERIHRAIADGDRFLESRPPNVEQSWGYELFGLERLGLASGRSHIGGVDWFRKHAAVVANRSWGGEVVADSFALLFLTHGRAPVLFQKLEHGAEPNEWNYYHRDLHALTRYLSTTFERLFRWQRIPQNATLDELQNAPFLYISGNGALSLSPSTQATIREYVDKGGTVFLHADRRGKQFIQSAKSTFEDIFADLDLRFRALGTDHPLFSCHFGGPDDVWRRPVPFEAIADGPRLLVILSPVDIAGAWHQNRRQFDDLFRIMANVRMYCAPPHSELPGVIRGAPPQPLPVQPLGTLRLKRWPYAGEWAAHRGVFLRCREAIRLRTGIEIDADERSDRPSEAALAEFGIVHLTTRSASKLNSEDLRILQAYLSGGGLLVIDSADGQPDGNAAVRSLFDAINIGEKAVLAAQHPLAKGAFPGGRSLLELRTTRDGTGLRRPHAPPPILIRTIESRVAVIACPFDLLAGLDGHFIYGRIGYEPESTRLIVDNILLWRMNELQNRARDVRRP